RPGQPDPPPVPGRCSDRAASPGGNQRSPPPVDLKVETLLYNTKPAADRSSAATRPGTSDHAPGEPGTRLCTPSPPRPVVNRSGGKRPSRQRPYVPVLSPGRPAPPPTPPGPYQRPPTAGKNASAQCLVLYAKQSSVKPHP